MEKKQYDLCLEILGRFHQQGILEKVLLIGSWSVVFYADYFKASGGLDFDSLKTRDIDFLVPRPSKISPVVNIPALVEDLGFTVSRNSQGLMRLDHPDLILEFLVPEKGAGQDKPVPLRSWGMNAVALRFLNFLTDNPIKVKVRDFHVSLPHPIQFSLHKLIVSQRRKKKDKAEKDYGMATELLRALIKRGDGPKIKDVFQSIPGRWKTKIVNALDPLTDQDIVATLKSK